MKRLICTVLLGIFVALLPLLGGCRDTGVPDEAIWGTETKNDDGTKRPRVLTTIAPLYCFTANIADKYCEVRCLLTTRGAHGYESSLQDNRAIASADLLIANGLKMDNFVSKIKDATANQKLKIVWTGDEIGKRGAEYIQAKAIQHGDHTHPGGNDMHVWLGNAEAKLQCEVILDALIQLDPAHADHYREQTKKYLAELDTLNTLAEPLRSLPGSIATFHDSFRYFGRSYLGDAERIAGAIKGAEGEDVGPAELAEQIDKFFAKGVKVIGREPQYRDREVNTLQRDLNHRYKADVVRVILLDPFETAEPAGGNEYTINKDAYLNAMRGNIERLIEALKP